MFFLSWFSLRDVLVHILHLLWMFLFFSFFAVFFSIKPDTSILITIFTCRLSLIRRQLFAFFLIGLPVESARDSSQHNTTGGEGSHYVKFSYKITLSVASTRSLADWYPKTLLKNRLKVELVARSREGYFFFSILSVK